MANGYIDLDGTGALAPTLAEWDAAQRVLKSPGAAFNLVEKLKNERNCSIVLSGDSSSTNNGGTATTNGSWLNQFVNILAAAFPAVTFVLKTGYNEATGAYDTSTTIQTGTGSSTCTIYNPSISGTIPTYLYGGSFMYEAYKPSALSADLIIFNHGFNIQFPSAAAADRWGLAGYMLAALDEMHIIHPEAGIIVVQQNPRSSDTLSSLQLPYAQELVARWKNADLLRVYDLFVRAGRPGSWYYDTTHSSADVANPIIAQFMWSSLFQTVGSQRCANPPTIGQKRGDNALLNAKFDTYSAGAATSWAPQNCVLSEDTTDYETGTRALIMTPSTDAEAYIEQTVANNALRPFQGRQAVLGARFRIPAGAIINVGIVGISRSGSADQRSPKLAGTDGRGGWVWKFTTINFNKFGSFVTGLVVRLYAAEAAGKNSAGGGVTVAGVPIAVDRVVLFPGPLPFDTL
jgi:hypothetical protein